MRHAGTRGYSGPGTGSYMYHKFIFGFFCCQTSVRASGENDLRPSMKSLVCSAVDRRKNGDKVSSLIP